MNGPASRWLTSDDPPRRVRLAPRRDERPNDFARPGVSACPFCAGAEEETPPELDRVDDGRGGWLARSVPNRYPAFERPDGLHEVLVESPRHRRRFVDLTADEATAAVTLWARRLAAHQRDGAFGYTLVFKNEGPAAGASLEHTHSQLIALAEPPAGAPLRRTDEGAVPIGQRDGLTLAAPPAPRFAYETHLFPVGRWSEGPAPSFGAFADDAAAAHTLATWLQAVIDAVTGAAGVAAYNLLLHTSPDAASTAGGAPWRIEILPRSAVVAGFELATGAWINATPPDEAAAAVRRRLGE